MSLIINEFQSNLLKEKYKLRLTIKFAQYL